MARPLPPRFAILLAIVSASGCGLGIIDDPENDPVEDTLTFEAAPAALRRLTISEYQSTLRSLFGDDIEVPTDLESDTIINGLEAIGAGSVTISANAVEKYEAAALDVGSQAVSPGRRDRLGVCTPKDAADSACWSSLVTTLGRKVFRRPLEQAEYRSLRHRGRERR